MKKVDVEKLISKSMLITTVLLLVMFCMVLIKKGYETINFSYYQMPYIVSTVSILLLVVAAVFVFFGFKKDQKLFEVSAWCAGLATFAMLLKINYETKALEFNLPTAIMGGRLIKFHNLMELVFFVYIIVMWVYTVYCINKK